jgi:hypothetical protein
MAIIRSTIGDGSELTPEQQAAMRAELASAAARPYTPDPDSPLLTDTQLAEFQPVNGTREERNRRMREREAANLGPVFGK